MKIKTNRNQLEGITLLLGYLLDTNTPKDIAERLVYGIVNKAFNKIRVKSESLKCPQSGWGISLTDQEAMAVFIFLQNVHIPERLYHYESIQINMMSTEIHKVYGHT